MAKKITNKEKIDVLQKAVKRLSEDVESIKDDETDNEIINNSIKEIMESKKQDFELDANIKFFASENPKKQKQMFFNELQEIMIKYKVHNVLANLIKKF